MRCNKCGGDNPDDRLVCGLCGHKLQSGRSGGDEAGEAGESGRALSRPTDEAADREAPGRARQLGAPASRPEIAPQDEASRRAANLLDFQGWKSPLGGLGPYLEACLYAGVLAVAVAACLWFGVLWPLYPLMAVLAVVAWLRRL